MFELLTSKESRLFFAVALNVLALLAAWRAARRINADALDAAGDAGLLFYLVQYVSVCVPGVLGALHPLTIGAAAVLLSGALALYGGRRKIELARPSVNASVVVGGCAAFVIGYTFVLILTQRGLPVISNDAITYHLPAAVQWLQTGKLGLYEAWFYNPANSYSPLAGSVFIEWLLAPLGNDMLARFVQAGPLVLLFVAVLNLGRRLGAEARVAAMIAAAAVLARPIIGQTILAKDDLFAAAFFVLAVDAMSRARLETKYGPWREGIALGLLFATKYTVLLSAPILLLLLGREWNWRRMLIVIACIATLAGPWYVRNAMLTGNPLFPTRIALGGKTILPGMLSVHRSDLLATASGAWQVFTGGYYGIPLALACCMIAGWIAAIFVGGKRVASDRLARTCVLGAALGIGIFVLVAPYGEMRFAYPALMLMFAAVCVALIRFPLAMQLALAAILLIASSLTAFKFVWIKQLLMPAVLIGCICAGAVFVHHRSKFAAKAFPLVIVGLAMGTMMYAYVNWTAYVMQCEIDAAAAWAMPAPDQYGEMGDAWSFARGEIPKGSIIAYANTYFTYPLMGFAYDRRVVYVPTRAELDRFTEMPAIPDRIGGEQIVRRVVGVLRENPDRAQWLKKLRASGASYLFVGKKLDETKDKSSPPEFALVAASPEHFAKVFDNDAATVFRISW